MTNINYLDDDRVYLIIDGWDCCFCCFNHFSLLKGGCFRMWAACCMQQRMQFKKTVKSFELFFNHHFLH